MFEWLYKKQIDQLYELFNNLKIQVEELKSLNTELKEIREQVEANQSRLDTIEHLLDKPFYGDSYDEIF